MKEAFESTVQGMFGYMTDLNKIDIDESKAFVIQAKGHDMLSLLYSFMDEFLFVFSSEYTIVKNIFITSIDLETFEINARGEGETFDLRCPS